jgi:hypothetical protein
MVWRWSEERGVEAEETNASRALLHPSGEHVHIVWERAWSEAEAQSADETGAQFSHRRTAQDATPALGEAAPPLLA